MRRSVRIVVGAAAAWAALGGAAGPARPQSKFGLVFTGERVDAGDVRSIALGGAGQLVFDSLAVLQPNPATLTVARRVTFGASQWVSVDRGRSATASEHDVSYAFGSFAFAFPVLPRVTVAFGYRGVSDADGHMVTRRTAPDGRPYGEFFNRSGGLHRFPVSVAVHVRDAVRLGAYYAIETGSIENRWDVVFSDPTVNPATSRERYRLRGRGVGAGVVVQPGRRFRVGVLYEGEVSYDADVTERHTNPLSNRDTTETVRAPERWEVSVAWRATRGTVLYATGSVRDDRRFRGLGFPPDRLVRGGWVALGAEFLPGVAAWGRRFPVRVSAAYERLPYEFPAGVDVTQWSVGLGTGFVFADGRGKIDVAVRGGATGSVGRNGIDDRFVRLYVGVSGSEVWKRERQGWW